MFFNHQKLGKTIAKNGRIPLYGFHFVAKNIER
jgi:hypothetical protein